MAKKIMQKIKEIGCPGIPGIECNNTTLFDRDAQNIKCEVCGHLWALDCSFSEEVDRS